MKNKQLQEIVDYLTKKYSPLAILMCGSRVYGKPRPDSDWDLLLITEKRKDRIKKTWKGYNLDVHVVNENYFKHNFAPDWAPPIAKSIILKDTGNVGEKLIYFMKKFLKSERFLKYKREYARIGNKK